MTTQNARWSEREKNLQEHSGNCAELCTNLVTERKKVKQQMSSVRARLKESRIPRISGTQCLELKAIGTQDCS